MSCPAFWIDDLQVLAARFSGCGIGPDIACLTLVDAWGLYVFLLRIAHGGTYA